jgi:hypothetical protein
VSTSITAVESRSEFKSFILFPHRLYRGNPYWVPPLISDERDTLSPGHNPAFDEAEARLFLAKRQGTIVGRIAAIISHAANRKYATRNLRFGWFDAVQSYEVAKSLLDAAAVWGRQRGMVTMTEPHGFTDLDNDTVDFRNTIRAGASLGARFVVEYVATADLNFACSYTNVNHIYRNPISLIGLSADGKFTWAEKFFIGGGVILGTLSDVTWQTADVTSGDDYLHTFTVSQNLGWEVYAGINIGTKCTITIGMNNNKGLAMNYGLESIKDGEIKYRQKDTAAADELLETFGVFLKAVLKI